MIAPIPLTDTNHPHRGMPNNNVVVKSEMELCVKSHDEGVYAPALLLLNTYPTTEQHFTRNNGTDYPGLGEGLRD